MRLKAFKNIGAVILHDLPRKEHSASLAADHSRTDHAGMHLKVILRSEILLDKTAHTLVSGEHDVAHSRTFIGYVHAVFIEHLGSYKKAFPAVEILIERFSGFFVHESVKMADLGSLRKNSKAVVISSHAIRLEHRLGITVPHLHRTHIE